MRKFIVLVMVAGIIFLVGWVLGKGIAQAMPAQAGTTETGLLIEQIQQLSSLVTTKVDVADVQVTQMNGYLGGVKAAILIKGDFLLGVDLSQAKFEQTNSAGKTAVLVLPEPTVTSPRLDQTRTRVFSIDDSGLWQIAPGDADKAAVINRAYEQAQNFIASDANDPGLIDKSRRQAESVLLAFFRAIGWSVQIRWADDNRARPGPSGPGRALFSLAIEEPVGSNFSKAHYGGWTPGSCWRARM